MTSSRGAAVFAVWALVATAAWVMPALGDVAPTGSPDADAAAAMRAEMALLVELDALAQPIPPEVLEIHRSWIPRVLGAGRSQLMEELAAAEAEGARALGRLREAGRPTSPPVVDALGPIAEADLAAIRAGRTIRLPAFVYRDAYVDLTQRGGAGPVRGPYGAPAPDPMHAPPGVPAPPPTSAPAWPPPSPPASWGEVVEPAPAAPGVSRTDAAPSAARAAPAALLSRGEADGAQRALMLALLVVAAGALVALAVIARSVHRARLSSDGNDALFDQLFEAGRRMTQALDGSEVATIAVNEALRLTSARHGAFLSVKPGEIAPVHSSREGLLAAHGLADGVLGRVAQTGQPVRLVSQDEPAITALPAALIAAPVLGGGRVRGVLLVVREASQPFSTRDVRALGQLAPMVGTAREAAIQHGRVAHLATVDELTGAMNRRRLDADIEHSLASGESQTGFVMVDVDHFKAFNDAFGHGAGDEALRIVARAIQEAVREDDTVYRYGGEEFSILLPNTSSAEVHAIAERVRAAVETASVVGDGSTKVTVSAGFALSAGGSPRVLVEAADRALYRAKEAGRNCVLGAAP